MASLATAWCPAPDAFAITVHPPAVPAASQRTVRMRRLLAGRSQAQGRRALAMAHREAGSSDDGSDSDDEDQVVYCGCLSAPRIVAFVLVTWSCWLVGVAMHFGLAQGPDLSPMLLLRAWMARRP